MSYVEDPFHRGVEMKLVNFRRKFDFEGRPPHEFEMGRRARSILLKLNSDFLVIFVAFYSTFSEK